MIVGFFITVAAVTLLGALLERTAVHPLKSPSVLVLIIITIGASIVFKGAAMLIWGKDTYALPHFSGETPIHVGGATFLPQMLWILGIISVTVLLLTLFFNFTIVGKAMRACAYNRRAASLMGINVKHMVLLSFGLSAALGAIAGIIVTPIALMDYDRGSLLALKGFGTAVLGGLGNNVGAVVAGLIIGLLETFSAGFISSHYKDAVALLVLLIVLFVKPTGLLGSTEAGKLKEF
jgi:branched-chain amino acid transport system permease protein